MKSKLYIICFLMLLLSDVTPLNSQPSIDKLDQALTKTFQKTNIPGMAVAILSKDEIIYQNNFGYADLATKKPYTENTIHNIGSASKTFIGIALMQLIEQGRLTLDTKINDVLPFKVVNPYHPVADITIRHLVTHTSTIRDRTFNYGLRAYVSDDEAKGNRKGLPFKSKIHFKRMLKNEKISLGEFLENTLSEKGKWYTKKNFYKEELGTNSKYSNIGSALAGYIVEVITGEQYGAYVVNNILMPLGMTASGWSAETTNPNEFASRYINGKVVPSYDLITYPDGGLVSSVTDLSRYQMEMIKGYFGESDFLSPASFKTLLNNQFDQPPLAHTIKHFDRRYGVFWNIFGQTGVGDIGHGGSDPGILSFMFFDPITGIGCILLTNTDEYKNHSAVVEMWELLVAYQDAYKE